MQAFLRIYDVVVSLIVKLAGSWFLPTLARFAFAATLLVYYWNSAWLKLGDGLFGFLSPSSGAYVQIFPKAMEAVSYDSSQLSWFHWAVVIAGTAAEFILPALIVLGLFTRLASVAMIGFITVQSLTDLYAHGGIDHPATVGAWFDRLSDGTILDQRLFWITILAILIVKGAGPLSVDKYLTSRTRTITHP